jgi:hypothetical protein
MIARALSLLCFCIALNACAGARAVSDVFSVDDAFSVRLERPWIDITAPAELPTRGMHLLTIHGVAFERLYLIGTLEPGRALVSTPRGKPRLLFRQDFTPTEFVEFLEASLSELGYVRISLHDVRPALLRGQQGVQFEASMQTFDGLDMSAALLAAQEGDHLNAILFLAPTEHYYPNLAPEIRRMFLRAAAP